MIAKLKHFCRCGYCRVGVEMLFILAVAAYYREILVALLRSAF